MSFIGNFAAAQSAKAIGEYNKIFINSSSTMQKQKLI